MNQTAFLNKVKQMGVEETYEADQAKRLSQGEASTLLGVCDHSFQRYILG